MNQNEVTLIKERFREKMNSDQLQNCMRCGYCLPHCPTFIISGGKETSSPRGRIALMRAVANGDLEPDAEFEKIINECLGCLACESVCPSGVKYMELLEDARDIICQTREYSAPVKIARKVVFKGLFKKQKNMDLFIGALNIYQKSGLRFIARNTGIMKLFPKSLVATEKVLPEVGSYKAIKNRPVRLPAEGEKLAKVGFFKGCLMDTMFITENNKTLKLLQKAGCEIEIPGGQACCAAIHGHSGEKDDAKDMAKLNIVAFENMDVDYIITNAGGCGAYLMEYDILFQHDPEWYDRAKKFVSKIKDISKILVELKFHKRFKMSLPEQIMTYQDSCHLRNVMKTFNEPRELLKSIEGVTYVEQKNAHTCCGSAGTYSILHADVSMQILDVKMKNVLDTKATTIVTANPGCLLQMRVGIEREGLAKEMKGVHIVEVLFDAVGLKNDKF